MANNDKLLAYALGAALGYGIGFTRSVLTEKDVSEQTWNGRTPQSQQETRGILILGDEKIRKLAADLSPASFNTQFGLGGYWFDVEKEEELRIGAAISEYVTEDGQILTDAVATKRPTFTVTGRVSEVTSSGLDNLIGQPFTPVTFGLITNAYDALMARLGIGRIDWKTAEAQSRPKTNKSEEWNGSGYLNKDVQEALPTGSNGSKAGFRQNRAVWFFTLINTLKLPLTVSTPWGLFRNMMIENASFRKENDPISTEASITFKQIAVRKTAVLSEANLTPSGIASESNPLNINFYYTRTPTKSNVEQVEE